MLLSAMAMCVMVMVVIGSRPVFKMLVSTGICYTFLLTSMYLLKQLVTDCWPLFILYLFGIGVKFMVIGYLFKKFMVPFFPGGGKGPWWYVLGMIIVGGLLGLTDFVFGDLFHCSNDFPGNNTPMQPRPSSIKGIVEE